MVTAVVASLDPQGPVARSMADLFWLMTGVGLAVFVVVAALLVWSLFRRRSDGERSRSGSPPPEGGAAPRSRRWILWGGVVMPLAILVVIFTATVQAMRAVPSTPPAGALSVQVVAHQWWWEVRYPTEGFTTANELHIPVGRPVAIELTSADVIHSFWVPSLGGKMDALPDGPNLLVLEADQAGEHNSECAEFCGLQHAQMSIVVVAEDPDRFAEWVSDQRRPAAEPVGETAVRGREVFLEGECSTCHTIRGTAADATKGPDLTHVAGRPTIGAGAAPNTSAGLATWVRNPHTVKEGVAMPSPELDDADLAAVLAYLETLE